MLMTLARTSTAIWMAMITTKSTRAPALAPNAIAVSDGYGGM